MHGTKVIKRELIHRQVSVKTAMIMLLAGLKLKLRRAPRQTETRIQEKMTGMLVDELVVQ